MAACAPQAVAPPGAASSGAAPTSAAAPASAPAPAATIAPAALTGTVSYWHTFTSQSEMDGLDKVTKAFNQKYPKVTVNSENVPNSDFMAKFTLAVQGVASPRRP